MTRSINKYIRVISLTWVTCATIHTNTPSVPPSTTSPLSLLFDTRYITRLFKKKKFFLTGMDGINQLQFFYFIFFLAGTIDSLNRTRDKRNLHDWYVCFHVVIVINIEKSCRDFTHTWKTICMLAQGLDFVSCHEPTKRSQPGDWQPPQLPPQKVMTSIHLCYWVETFIILTFSSRI